LEYFIQKDIIAIKILGTKVIFQVKPCQSPISEKCSTQQLKYIV